MSTQDISNSIPLSHAPDGTGYKLMELPPELLELLESQDPPTQKNTSNALILLTPAASPASGRADEGPPAAGLSTIATVHETIEIVPEDGAAAAPAPKARGKWHEKFGRGR
ncbi:hypothetical protein P885DRAFT_64070 [Corynascus similis CBS 632.67]